MIWTIIAIVLTVLAIVSITVQKKEKKEMERRKPTHRTEYETLYLFDSDMEEKFFDFYKNELDENADYDLTAKELKEDYMDEKVWRYYPYQLPFRTEGDVVYSQLNEEWVRIGKIKSKDVDKLEEGEVSLHLYPKIYKYVTEDGIQRESGRPYFALTVKKLIEL